MYMDSNCAKFQCVSMARSNDIACLVVGHGDRQLDGGVTMT